ncbi:MAG: hypothetical protein ABIP54_02610 [Candidatus Andersenbacteria bacterium]
MSGYGDVKRRKFINLLKWLHGTGEIEVIAGSRHTKIEHIRTGDVYPVPTAHRTVNKHIVKAFQKWLEARDVCSKKEFDKRL